MNIDIALSPEAPNYDLNVGNVYAMRGGRGASLGYMQIVVAVTNVIERGYERGRIATYITVNRDGEIIGGGSYGAHYLEEKCPIAFVEGLEDLTLAMRSL